MSHNSLPIGCVVFVFVLTGYGQTNDLFSRPAPPPSSVASSQEQLIPYWTAEGGWHTEIKLRNNLASLPLTVTPILRTADGSDVRLSATTIPVRGVATVDITSALDDSAASIIGGSNAFGSVVLMYNSFFNRNLFASVMVHDAGHPIMYHFDGTTVGKGHRLTTREGIWWLPNSSTNGYLVLTNLSTMPLSGLLYLYSADGTSWSTPVALSAKNTQRLSVRNLVEQAHFSGKVGGIKVRITNGNIGALV